MKRLLLPLLLVVAFLVHAVDMTDFTRCVEITVSYMPGEPLSDFPALVRLGTSISGFDYADFKLTDGGDLRFLDADGNLLRLRPACRRTLAGQRLDEIHCRNPRRRRHHECRWKRGPRHGRLDECYGGCRRWQGWRWNPQVQLQLDRLKCHKALRQARRRRQVLRLRLVQAQRKRRLQRQRNVHPRREPSWLGQGHRVPMASGTGQIHLCCRQQQPPVVEWQLHAPQRRLGPRRVLLRERCLAQVLLQRSH